MGVSVVTLAVTGIDVDEDGVETSDLVEELMAHVLGHVMALSHRTPAIDHQ